MKTSEKIGIASAVAILIYLIIKYAKAEKPSPTPTQPTQPAIPTQPQKYIKNITIKPEKNVVYLNEPLYIDYEIIPNEGVEPPKTIIGELTIMRVVNPLTSSVIKTPKPIVKEVILNPNSGKIKIVFDKIYGKIEDKYDIRLSTEGVYSNLIRVTVKRKIKPTIPPPPTIPPTPTTYSPTLIPSICSSSDPPPQTEILHNVI